MNQSIEPSNAADDNDDTANTEATPRRVASVQASRRTPVWFRRWGLLALAGLALIVVIALVVASAQSAARPASTGVTRIVPAENTVALGSPMVVDGLMVAVTKMDIKNGQATVEMLVKNTGAKKLDISASTVFLMTPDAKSQDLDADATAKLGDDALYFGTLAPGQNVSGTLVFSSSVYKLPTGMLLRMTNPDLFDGNAFFALWK